MKLETAMKLVETNLTGKSQNSRAAARLLHHIQSEDLALTRLRARLEYLESEEGPEATLTVAEIYRIIGQLAPPPPG